VLTINPDQIGATGSMYENVGPEGDVAPENRSHPGAGVAILTGPGGQHLALRHAKGHPHRMQ